MIQNKHKFAFLLCMLLMTTTVYGASEAEYKKLAKTWTLNADGSQEFRYDMELTLFTHTAMNGTYGESFIVYNPQYQELKINSSYTKQKDGTIIKTPDNAFVEVLPRNAADAPAYNHLKEMVVVHTGLELGATIYLDYTVTSKPGYLPEVDIFEELLQSSPVKEYTLTIVTPEVKELAYTLTNNPAKASVKRSGGTCTTSWTLRNLPASSRAPFVYVKNGDVPFLAATTYASEGEALATLLKQFNPSGDPQLTTLAESLTEGKKKDEDKLEAILEYTTNHIANNGLTLDQTGYRLRPADAVMSTAYGTEAEKANLLAGLLDGAGFKAEPMATYQAYADKGLALKAVDQLFVSCMVNGELYLFSTSSTHRPQTVNFDRTPLFSLQTGKPVAIAVPQDYLIKSDIAPFCQKLAQILVFGRCIELFVQFQATGDGCRTSVFLDGDSQATGGIADRLVGFRGAQFHIFRTFDRVCIDFVDRAWDQQVFFPLAVQVAIRQMGEAISGIRQ